MKSRCDEVVHFWFLHDFCTFNTEILHVLGCDKLSLKDVNKICFWHFSKKCLVLSGVAPFQFNEIAFFWLQNNCSCSFEWTAYKKSFMPYKKFHWWWKNEKKNRFVGWFCLFCRSFSAEIMYYSKLNYFTFFHTIFSNLHIFIFMCFWPYLSTVHVRMI